VLPSRLLTMDTRCALPADLLAERAVGPYTPEEAEAAIAGGERRLRNVSHAHGDCTSLPALQRVTIVYRVQLCVQVQGGGHVPHEALSATQMHVELAACWL
jgi:hypothetical protein